MNMNPCELQKAQADRMANCRPLSSDDRLLLWRFRWNLTGEKRALTKVLQSVDWGDVQEARQGIKLLSHWVAIDVADALELLSPSFLNPEVWLLHCEIQWSVLRHPKTFLVQELVLLSIGPFIVACLAL